MLVFLFLTHPIAMLKLSVATWRSHQPAGGGAMLVVAVSPLALSSLKIEVAPIVPPLWPFSFLVPLPSQHCGYFE